MTLHTRLRISLAAAVFLLAACATPSAGPKLSDVLAKGARKGTRADVAQFLDRKMPPTVTPNGMQADLLYKSDGTFDGTLKVLQGPNAGATTRDYGTWTMDDSGRFCITENMVDFKRTVSKCMNVYVTGNEVWVTNDGAANGDPAVLFGTLPK